MATSLKTYLTVGASITSKKNPSGLFLSELFSTRGETQANEDEREGSLQDCGASSRLGPTLPRCWRSHCFFPWSKPPPELNPADLFWTHFCWWTFFPSGFLWFFHVCTSFKGQSEYNCFRSERENSICFLEKKEKKYSEDLYTNWPFCHCHVCLGWGLIQGPRHPQVLNFY